MLIDNLPEGKAPLYDIDAGPNGILVFDKGKVEHVNPMPHYRLVVPLNPMRDVNSVRQEVFAKAYEVLGATKFATVEAASAWLGNELGNDVEVFSHAEEMGLPDGVVLGHKPGSGCIVVNESDVEQTIPVGLMVGTNTTVDLVKLIPRSIGAFLILDGVRLAKIG